MKDFKFYLNISGKRKIIWRKKEYCDIDKVMAYTHFELSIFFKKINLQHIQNTVGIIIEAECEEFEPHRGLIYDGSVANH